MGKTAETRALVLSAREELTNYWTKANDISTLFWFLLDFIFLWIW